MRLRPASSARTGDSPAVVGSAGTYGLATRRRPAAPGVTSVKVVYAASSGLTDYVACFGRRQRPLLMRLLLAVLDSHVAADDGLVVVHLASRVALRHAFWPSAMA